MQQKNWIREKKVEQYSLRQMLYPLGVLLVLGTLLFGFSAPASGESLLYTFDDIPLFPDSGVGPAVADLGDVNSDGVPDFAVGAAGRTGLDNTSGKGEVLVISGSTGTVLFTLSGYSKLIHPYFGHSLAVLGDVNGDGIPDIAVGAPGRLSEPGQVFVISAAPNGALLYDILGDKLDVDSDFGWSLAPVKSTRNIIAVGAPGKDFYLNPDQGQAYTFADKDLMYPLDHPKPQGPNRFGYSLAVVGDLDKDGLPDIAVGSPGDAASPKAFPGVFVFSTARGNLLFSPAVPDLIQADSQFGYSLTAGDLDGDRRPEILVGAPRMDVGVNRDQGQVFVFSAASSSILTLDDPNPKAGNQFGHSLAMVGDVDKDGVPDFAVGALYQVFVFSGATGSLIHTLDDPNPLAGGSFGWSLAGVGDVNNDGLPDIAVGANRGLDVESEGKFSYGQVFVFSLAASGGATPGGTDVIVQPIDPNSNTSPVTMTFEDVTSSGETSVTTSGQGTPPPNGFKLGNPPVYYNIETTAGYTGSVQICINYSGISYGKESNLRLFHETATGWQDVTISLDTDKDIICGAVSSLSPFGVFEQSYSFTGFLPPVDKFPLVNSAKAGQVIPVKWRITDANGAPISDPASFTEFTSYSMNCNNLDGDPISAIEEYAAGSSGLQYVGDGYWQFNWKTPTNYAGQCRRMVLKLGDGSTPTADFKFK